MTYPLSLTFGFELEYPFCFHESLLIQYLRVKSGEEPGYLKDKKFLADRERFICKEFEPKSENPVHPAYHGWFIRHPKTPEWDTPRKVWDAAESLSTYGEEPLAIAAMVYNTRPRPGSVLYAYDEPLRHNTWAGLKYTTDRIKDIDTIKDPWILTPALPPKHSMGNRDLDGFLNYRASDEYLSERVAEVVPEFDEPVSEPFGVAKRKAMAWMNSPCWSSDCINLRSAAVPAGSIAPYDTLAVILHDLQGETLARHGLALAPRRRIRCHVGASNGIPAQTLKQLAYLLVKYEDLFALLFPPKSRPKTNDRMWDWSAIGSNLSLALYRSHPIFEDEQDIGLEDLQTLVLWDNLPLRDLIKIMSSYSKNGKFRRAVVDFRQLKQNEDYPDMARGSIVFSHHESTMDVEAIRTYSNFCQALVRLAHKVGEAAQTGDLEWDRWYPSAELVQEKPKLALRELLYAMELNDSDGMYWARRLERFDKPKSSRRSPTEPFDSTNTRSTSVRFDLPNEDGVFPREPSSKESLKKPKPIDFAAPFAADDGKSSTQGSKGKEKDPQRPFPFAPYLTLEDPKDWKYDGPVEQDGDLNNLIDDGTEPEYQSGAPPHNGGMGPIEDNDKPDHDGLLPRNFITDRDRSRTTSLRSATKVVPDAEYSPVNIDDVRGKKPGFPPTKSTPRQNDEGDMVTYFQPLFRGNAVKYYVDRRPKTDAEKTKSKSSYTHFLKTLGSLPVIDIEDPGLIPNEDPKQQQKKNKRKHATTGEEAENDPSSSKRSKSNASGMSKKEKISKRKATLEQLLETIPSKDRKLLFADASPSPSPTETKSAAGSDDVMERYHAAKEALRKAQDEDRERRKFNAKFRPSETDSDLSLSDSSDGEDGREKVIPNVMGLPVEKIIGSEETRRKKKKKQKTQHDETEDVAGPSFTAPIKTATATTKTTLKRRDATLGEPATTTTFDEESQLHGKTIHCMTPIFRHTMTGATPQEAKGKKGKEVIVTATVEDALKVAKLKAAVREEKEVLEKKAKKVKKIYAVEEPTSTASGPVKGGKVGKRSVRESKGKGKTTE
ncbi:hypothetical protein MMC25_005039 [Agyrium rufum]|nr:hypothetical protein [Agyrium rufum]